MSVTNHIIILMLCPTLIFQVNGEKLEKQMIESYQDCQLDKDCKENSFCYGNDDNKSGKCKCLNGYELFRNSTFYECLEGVKLGDACESDRQCMIVATSEAFCNKYKICNCRRNSANYNGICYKTAKLGELCSTDGHCHTEDGTENGTFAFCSLGRCACKNDQRPSEDNTRCLKSSKLGDPCIADEECTIITPNTKCSSKCECNPSHTLTRDETSCAPAATKFGEACDFDGQCSKLLQQSICKNARCGCEAGFHDYGYKCVETRKTGETCIQDAECIYEKELRENVKCEGGLCKCLFGSNSDKTCKLEKFLPDSNSTAGLIVTATSVQLLFILRCLIF